MSGVDEREPPLGREPQAEGEPEPVVASALPPPPTPATGDGTPGAGWRTQQPEPPPPAQTGWPTTPAEIPLDGRHAFPEGARAEASGAAPTFAQPRRPADGPSPRPSPGDRRLARHDHRRRRDRAAREGLRGEPLSDPVLVDGADAPLRSTGLGLQARFSDRVLANRFIYHLRDPRRGEIVVFDTPDAARVKCGAGGRSSSG